MEKDYIELEVYAKTNMVGSKCTTTVQVYNEEIEGMTEKEKENYIEDICKDNAFDMIDWGYKIKK